jgi:hypothetical protein
MEDARPTVLEWQIDAVGECTALNTSLRQRWSHAQSQPCRPKNITLKDIEDKLAAAERRRLVRICSVFTLRVLVFSSYFPVHAWLTWAITACKDFIVIEIYRSSTLPSWLALSEFSRRCVQTRTRSAASWRPARSNPRKADISIAIASLCLSNGYVSKRTESLLCEQMSAPRTRRSTCVVKSS